MHMFEIHMTSVLCRHHLSCVVAVDLLPGAISEDSHLTLQKKFKLKSEDYCLPIRRMWNTMSNFTRVEYP
jgi:hypothetical protein